MARKKNTWIHVGVGALLISHLMKKNKPAGGGAAPGGGGAGPAFMDALQQSDAIASGITFEIDRTTDRQLYADSQKTCK